MIIIILIIAAVFIFSGFGAMAKSKSLSKFVIWLILSAVLLVAAGPFGLVGSGLIAYWFIKHN